MLSLQKMSFSITLVLGSLITISSNSWLGMWMGLEINLLSIIPLMSNSNNPRETEASLKYFITQVMASMILLTSILMINSHHWNNSSLEIINMPDMLMTSSLLLKAGIAPFHFWLPEVIEGCSWMNSLIILTWQKIAPLTMIMYNSPLIMLVISILMSVLIGSTLGLNQTSLRKILAFSSINHMGWMLSSIIVSDKIWLMYLAIYSTMNTMLIWMFNTYKVSTMNQISMIVETNPILKTFFMLNLLSLGGVPPMIGFLPKWIVIQSLVSNHLYNLSLILILTALITLYFYLRIALSSFIFSPPYLLITKKNFKILMLTVMSSLLLFSLIIYSGLFNLT